MARPTVARIDLDAIAHNVAEIRKLVGKRKICAAVKADAYGHGAAVISHALSRAGVDMFAVAMTEEAVDLRRAGIREPIILLTAAPTEDVDDILDYEVTACIAEEGFAGALSRRASKRGMLAPIHVNVDTGMHRVGLDWRHAAKAICRLQGLPGLRVEGVFSHFACSDADELSTSYQQLRRFKKVLGQLLRAGLRPPIVHMANSNGVLRLPEAYFDAVRPGLILYGLVSRRELRSKADFRPALSMRTQIAHVKRVPQGEGVSYGHTFTTWRDSVIATLPVGYHDGYIRQFSSRGEVLVRGRRVPVVGRVCMDQTLVDVTDVPGAAVGDEVVIYGEQDGRRLGVEEMAERVDRIPYELTCAVSPRVRREFVSNGSVVVETPCRSVIPSGSFTHGFLTAANGVDEEPGAEPAKRGAA